MLTELESKPRYEAPMVFVLGELATGRGECSTGSVAAGTGPSCAGGASPKSGAGCKSGGSAQNPCSTGGSPNLL